MERLGATWSGFLGQSEQIHQNLLFTNLSVICDGSTWDILSNIWCICILQSSDIDVRSGSSNYLISPLIITSLCSDTPWDLVQRLCVMTENYLLVHLETVTATFHDSWLYISSFQGIGRFMSWQIRSRWFIWRHSKLPATPCCCVSMHLMPSKAVNHDWWLFFRSWWHLGNLDEGMRHFFGFKICSSASGVCAVSFWSRCFRHWQHFSLVDKAVWCLPADVFRVLSLRPWPQWV